jgi:hypothetical protein
VGVLVVGMHRSGTSAVAAALEAMGLQVGRSDDRLAPDLMNPAGYFELTAVNDLNQEILHHLGGNWDAPPRLTDGWMADPTIEPFVHRARHLVTSTLGDDFVLKDPRLCLLLPLWRRILADRFGAVLIVRDPVEVAWSLALRDGMQILTGLALWGAYNRSALQGLAGLPVHVCRYEDLVEQPGVALGAMAAALQSFGQLAPGADVEAGLAVIQPELRRNTWPPRQTELFEVPADVRILGKVLTERRGSNGRFEAEVPDPGWWERSVLEERRIAGVRLRAAEASTVALRAGLAESEAAGRRSGADLEMLRGQLAESTARLAEASAQSAEHLARAESAQAALAQADARWAALERRVPVRLYRGLRRLIDPTPR